MLFERVRRFGRLVKIEHTLFSLPFAVGSFVLASAGRPHLPTLGWILLALVSGRFLGMAANRVIDRHVDARNPRTRDREIPAGALGIPEVAVFMLTCMALLGWAVWHLPPLCAQLLPVALVLVVGYSYTKFLTPACHWVLGLVLATPVVGARIAVRGVFDPEILLVAVAVVVWVAGFDIMYACQDAAFDRAQRLHSIPARIGEAASLSLALAQHALVAPLLVAFGLTQGYGARYMAGMAVIGAILLWEHRLARKGDPRLAEKAFFEANVLVSATFLATTLVVTLG